MSDTSRRGLQAALIVGLLAIVPLAALATATRRPTVPPEATRGSIVPDGWRGPTKVVRGVHVPARPDGSSPYDTGGWLQDVADDAAAAEAAGQMKKPHFPDPWAKSKVP